MNNIERGHARFMAGTLTYDNDVAAQVDGHLDDVVTHVSRGDIAPAIAAAYAAIGAHEDWLLETNR